MPCTYYTPEEERRHTTEELNKLTRLLCEAARLLERLDLTPPMSEELRAWLKEHKRLDELREAEELAKHEREQKRQEALRKLSPEEREALGL